MLRVRWWMWTWIVALLGDSPVELRADSLFLANSENYANTILSQSPYVYWRLNETVGTTAFDETGNLRHATYTASPTLGDPGPRSPAFLGFTTTNNAPAFDGTSDQRALSTLTGLGAGDYTVSMWIRNTRPLAPTPPAIIGYLFSRSDTTNSDGDHLGITGSFPDGAALAGRLLLYNGNTLAQSLTGSTIMNPDDWYHVALTRSGTTVAGYVNGSLEFSSAAFGNPWTSGNPLITMGTRSDLFGDMQGNLDEVAVFARVLSQPEIQSQFASAFALPPVPPLAPEPGTLVLLGTAGALLLGHGWRRRKLAARA